LRPEIIERERRRILHVDHLGLVRINGHTNLGTPTEQLAKLGAERFGDVLGGSLIELGVEIVLPCVGGLVGVRVLLSRTVAEKPPVENQIDVFGEPFDQAEDPG
jgi:hypothetical protein